MFIGQKPNSTGTVVVQPAISVNPPMVSTPFLPVPNNNNGMAVGWRGKGTLVIQSGTGNDLTKIDRNPQVGVLTVGGGTDVTGPGGSGNPLYGTSLTGGNGTVIMDYGDTLTATAGIWAGGPRATAYVRVRGKLLTSDPMAVGWGAKSTATIEIDGSVGP